MTDFCEHGTFESICNLCHRDNIIARLRAENFSLASWQCEFTDGKTGLVQDEHGNQYCAMAKMVEALTAKNERLRAALLPFASIKADDGHDYISSWPDTVIVRCEASVRELKAARTALDEK